MQISGLIAVAYLAVSSLWTANDPFVGTWKLDISRSKAVDQMKIDAAGANKYAFKFEGAAVETIVADGTDQPGLTGTTLAATIEGPRAWKIVRKQAGRVIVSAIWKLSEDGRTLRDSFTGTQPDGSTSTTDYLYRRTSGKAGFTGVWESTDVAVSTAYELEIQPYGTRGLSFAIPAAGSVKNIAFDGQDHPVASALASATASGRRGNARTIEITDKVAGTLVDRRAYRLSRDGKTLTLTMQVAGQGTPNVLVFERE